MTQIIVTLKHSNQSTEQDFDLPADMPTGQLAQLLAQTCGWGTQGQLETDSPPRVLSPHETLTQAQVGDGSWLIFRPISISTPPYNNPVPPPNPLPVGSGPVTGWRPLKVPTGTPSTPPSTGYVKKRLD